MTDRGEMIVRLAKALLDAEKGRAMPHGHPSEAKQASQSPAPFRANLRLLCLTAFLSGCCGAVLSHFASERARPVNRYEQTEIDALLFYVAQTKGDDPGVLAQKVSVALKLPSLHNISVADYFRVREKLRDLLQ